MEAELDHLFICCAPGAPEAEALLRLGFREGSANVHPGQGTSCRRFFFRNLYLELLWVSDPVEAKSDSARPTRLWERCTSRAEGASPFAVVLRPAAGAVAMNAPFPTWDYHPRYLPPHLAIGIALDTPLAEPAFFHLGFQRGRARQGEEPIDHALPVAKVTAVAMGMPAPEPWSEAVRTTAALGLVSFQRAPRHFLELVFDGARHGERVDLSPELPLGLRW